MIEISQKVKNLDNIILNELRNIIARMEQKYEISEMLNFLELIREKICNRVECKRLSKNNRIVYLLLKYKQYKMIAKIYLLKGKIKRRKIYSNNN